MGTYVWRSHILWQYHEGESMPGTVRQILNLPMGIQSGDLLYRLCGLWMWSNFSKVTCQSGFIARKLLMDADCLKTYVPTWWIPSLLADIWPPSMTVSAMDSIRMWGPVYLLDAVRGLGSFLWRGSGHGWVENVPFFISLKLNLLDIAGDLVCKLEWSKHDNEFWSSAREDACGRVYSDSGLKGTHFSWSVRRLAFKKMRQSYFNRIIIGI